MAFTLAFLVSAVAARRSSISSPTSFVNLSLPRAGGERRAIDRPANASRATSQEHKIEAPPDAVATPRGSTDLFSFSSEIPDWRGACASVDRADLEVEQAELERSDQGESEAPDMDTAGSAPWYRLVGSLVHETEAVPMPLPVPPKTELAEAQRSEASSLLRNYNTPQDLVRPTEVCATQIADSKTAELTDLFSISSDFAGSWPHCASFIWAQRGAAAAVAWHAEPHHALTDELYKTDEPLANPPVDILLSIDLPSPSHFPFISGQSSSAPGRTRQRIQVWAALLLLGAFGVLLSEWVWPPRFGAALVRWSNSGGRLVQCRTGSRRGAWLLLLAVLPLACAPSPSPPPPPPLPPLPTGFVATASIRELQSLITWAAASRADVSIYLPPSADFKLNSQIRCASSIKVIVASSGEGATLDGQEQTRLFYLSGGCSLTLRGLNLVETATSSLPFLHPCAAVLALLLAACFEPLLRGQVKKKRVEGRRHAASSVHWLASTRALRVGIVIIFFLQGVCGTPAAPLQPVSVSSPCSLTDGGLCATSPNYPNSYGINEACTISGVPLVELETVAFNVEAGDGCRYDYLTVNGVKYCGTSGPSGAVAEDGVITWRSDGSGVRSGWKICWPTRPPSPPSPPSPPLAPPPPPLSPLPPLSPPAPPRSPGFDVVAETENELRSLIEDAIANVSIYLPPGAHFKLGSRIICTSSIKVTVASSGEGATLDGKGETGLFSLSYGCSLTLRGLTLVNARAHSGGGWWLAGRGGVVVAAWGAGDVEIIESMITNCRADYSGGVVFARDSGAVSIINSTVTGCSAGQEGGVVYAIDSGAVSLIGSPVTGCSAEHGGVVSVYENSGAVSIIGSTVSGCSAIWYGGVVFVYDNSGAVSIIDSDVRDCSAGHSGGVVDAFNSGAVSIINSTVTGCSAGQSGGVVALTTDTDCLGASVSRRDPSRAPPGGARCTRRETDLIVTDSTISGCNATRGGAVYVRSGSASLTRSTISNCIATESGGGLYSEGGRTSLSDGTLISGCLAQEGRSVFLLAGEVSYTLPAPAGRWLPNARCEVYREACATDDQGRPTNDCPNHRETCAINLVVQNNVDPWYCQEPTVVQPCNWDSTRGGDPSLLGESLYQLPLLPVDEDFPFACAAGLLGSADPKEQSSSSCAGRCPAGSQCPTEATYEALPCDAGHVCPEGTSVPLPCPAGSYSNATDLAAASECTDASPGHFATTGSTQQTPCTKGSYTDAYGQGECTPCAGGSYQDAEAQTGCKACEQGSYCPEGASAPLPCEAGSYSRATDLTAALQCTAADPGYFATTGSTEQTPCREGSFAAEERSEACELCAQGYYQSEPGQAACVRCAFGKYCPLGSSRELDAQCSPGTYANVTDADGDPECLACPAGSSCAGGGAAPAVCSPGTAAKPAQDQCTVCDVGTYQPDSGAAGCLECALGTFCPKGSSAQLPATCPAGFYNGKASTTLESLDDCVGCAPGSFCAGGAAQPTACAPGSIAPSANMSACELCPIGRFAASTTECEECEAGTYAASDGLSQCTPCPYPTSSESGDVTCPICKEGFYLQDASALPDDIFRFPTEHCKACPPNANCATNITLETLGVQRNHWRASLLTTEIHECDASDHCSGSGGATQTSRRLAASGGAGPGCDLGHTGPLCEWCVSDEQYFSRAERGCTDCPTTGRFGILAGVVVALAGTGLFLYRALPRAKAWGRFRARLDIVESQVGFQPKFKILVSFYQIAATLGPVYGVRLHEDFTRWTDFMDAISFDLLGLTYPDACIGSMGDRLLLAGLWPIPSIMLGGAAFACCALAEWLLSGRADALRRDLVRATQSRLLYWAILVAYLVLPSVSRSIFKAKQCESFNVDDVTGERRSYLVADLDVLCSAGDDEYSGLDAYFWAFFVLWPVLVPLAFLALLLSIRSEVRAQRDRATARACRFLWRDYDPRFLFWEVVDLGRKLFLASLVLFIQTDTGSSKLLRLFVASVISALYLAVLALARPFKRDDDLYLACTANLLLACCFISGMVIQLCESAAYEEMCKTLVGFDSAHGASEFVVALTAAMLAASLLVLLFKTISAVRAPTIRLVTSDRPPTLELPPECHFHGFISHCWGTGQDQTHTVVRRLQLLLPGVRIWLDVDNLEDVGRLEESVRDATTFLVFLSAGYFKSFNCRRELYAALASNRPFIPIHEADVDKGGASIEALKAECREHCVEVAPPAYPSYSGPGEMLARVFEASSPIVWVRVNAFQLESLKAVALRMLLHSPYYASRPAELADGVMVPAGEAGPVAFSGPVTILVCRDNEGAVGIARELKTAAREGRGSTASAETVVIRDAEEALEGASAAPLSGYVVFLLYLNDKTFLDAVGAVARLVQAAMDRRIAIAMVHEQDPIYGGVPFRNFFQQTPQVLLQPPYKLFDTVAVPLFPAPEHRKMSRRLVLSSMGAVPCDAGPLQRRWQLLRRHIAVARLVRGATKQTAQSRVRRVTALARTTQPRGSSSKMEPCRSSGEDLA